MTDMTIHELVDAINGNAAMTEAEAITPHGLALTVRPKNSSRTFTAVVRVESIREV